MGEFTSLNTNNPVYMSETRMEFLTLYLFTPNIIARLTHIRKYMKDILNIYANSLWIRQANLAFSFSVELTSFLLWNMKDKNENSLFWK